MPHDTDFDYDHNPGWVRRLWGWLRRGRRRGHPRGIMSWPAPQPEPCPVIRCWIGRCGETDRTQCRHFSYVKKWPKCRCGRPALGECENAGSLVCGAPICRATGFCSAHGGSCSPMHETTDFGDNPSYKEMKRF